MKLTLRGELAQRSNAVQQRLGTLNGEIKLAIEKNREANRPIFEPLQLRVIPLFNAAMNPSSLDEVSKIEQDCARIEEYFQSIKPRTPAFFSHALLESAEPKIDPCRRKTLELEESLAALAQKIKGFAAANNLEGDPKLRALWAEGIGIFNSLSSAFSLEEVKKIESESAIPYAKRVEDAIHPNTGFIWQKKSVPETENEILRFRLERNSKKLSQLAANNGELKAQLAAANNDIERMKITLASYASAFNTMLDLLRRNGFRVELIVRDGIQFYGIGKPSGAAGEQITIPANDKTDVN